MMKNRSTILPEGRARERSGRRPAQRKEGAPQDEVLTRLIILGWIVALLYFPSGMLHGVLSAGVYIRDILLGAHLIASIVWLVKKRQLDWVARNSWVILITPVLLIPAVITQNYTMEALRTCKWSLCWLDWIILGHQLRMNKHWGNMFKLLGIITILMMCIELVAGVVEWQTGSYLFPTEWGETTAFGVQRGNDQALEGRIRIHGLQRDVFSFANVMGMNAVAGMAGLTIFRKPALRLAAGLWAGAFGMMMLVSGGRSALFGAFAALIYTGYLLLARTSARNNGRRYVLAWVTIAIILSLVGVGSVTDFIGGQVLGGSYVGDSDSAYMRDNYWVKMRGAFVSQPLILIIGGPFASVIDSKIDVMFHWADNQLLWNLYHAGIAGSLAFVFFFYKVIEDDPRENDVPVRQALILFLVFVIGEGIARESLTFIGCLPLFLLCGYDRAGEWLGRRDSSTNNRVRLWHQPGGHAR